MNNVNLLMRCDVLVDFELFKGWLEFVDSRDNYIRLGTIVKIKGICHC